jgi:dienelactone hydrolase
MLTATEQYMAMTGTPFRFAGHVAHYPVCWLYNNVPGFEFANLTGAPVLIQTGELDDYDLPETCANMIDNLAEVDKETVELRSFNNAYHAWDRLEAQWLVTDPYSHLGQGGEVLLAPNKRIARKSKRKVVRFFKDVFQLTNERNDGD